MVVWKKKKIHDRSGNNIWTYEILKKKKKIYIYIYELMNVCDK